MGKKINNNIKGDFLWRGLGGHFDSITQILNEFIDNSISNLKSNKHLSIKQIQITIKEFKENICITIEDTGTGFENIDSAFTLGSQEHQDSTMNEHGFGFKHALATANPENNNWIILTRTVEQFNDGVYTKITSPYKIENFECEECVDVKEQWSGSFQNGTLFEFYCSKELFSTVVDGVKGRHGFHSHITHLVEDLGFTYSEIIKDGNANIRLIAVNKEGKEVYNDTIASVDPEINNLIHAGSGKEAVALDGDIVTIEYMFSDAKKHSTAKKYYQKSMSTSGVEIRINGRLIMYNLFKEIWGIEKHNCYNYLLIKLNLISDNKEHLPTTRTSKNGIRKGDKKLEALYEWIRKKMGSKPPRQSNKDGDGQDELTLFEQLEELKNKQIPEPKIISLEQQVFSAIGWGIRIDLWQNVNNNLTIYEGKKFKTTPQDVYQLKMYWDGCILDNIQPNEGIVIASQHPESVKKLIDQVNTMKDLNGKNYNFKLKTWRDEGINFPPAGYIEV